MRVSSGALLALLEILEGRARFAKARGANDFFAQRKT